MIRIHARRRVDDRQGKAEHAKEAPARGLTLLSIRDAADYARVSQTTVRRWINRAEIRTYRAGKQLRIDESDLVAFLSE